MVVDSGSSWSQPHRTKINVVNMDGKKAQKKFHVDLCAGRLYSDTHCAKTVPNGSCMIKHYLSHSLLQGGSCVGSTPPPR